VRSNVRCIVNNLCSARKLLRLPRRLRKAFAEATLLSSRHGASLRWRRGHACVHALQVSGNPGPRHVTMDELGAKVRATCLEYRIMTPRETGGICSRRGQPAEPEGLLRCETRMNKEKPSCRCCYSQTWSAPIALLLSQYFHRVTVPTATLGALRVAPVGFRPSTLPRMVPQYHAGIKNHRAVLGLGRALGNAAAAGRDHRRVQRHGARHAAAPGAESCPQSCLVGRRSAPVAPGGAANAAAAGDQRRCVRLQWRTRARRWSEN
jgi:hypothetical protein